MPHLEAVSRMETQSAFMAGAAALVLLAAVLRDRHDRRGLLFGSLIFCFGTWCLGRGMANLGIVAALRLETGALVLVGALAPMAAAAFAGREATLRRYRAVLLVGPPVLCAAAIAGGVERAEVRALVFGWAFAGAVAATFLLWHPRASDFEPGSPDATRLRFLGIAHAIVVVGAVADGLAYAGGFPRVITLLTPLLYLYAGYLYLLRVRVADLRHLLGSAIALSILALGVAGFFGALWWWVGPQLDLFAFNAFVGSFLLFLLVDPIRSRMRGWIERRFVEGRLELERTLGPLRERLAQVFTLDEFLQEVLEAVERSERLRATAIFLRDDPRVGFQQAGSVGLPSRFRVNLIRAPVWVSALLTEDALLREELEKLRGEQRKDDEIERASALLRTMDRLDAQLVLPLRSDGNLMGFWTLRDERDREPFSSSDVEFLRSVADQMARTIEKTKTFEQVRVRDRFANLGEMAAGLAHEIRNPLATIRAAAAILEDPGAESPREIRAVIAEEIERLDRVVDTFLDYTRPSPQRQEIPDVGAFVHGCTASVARGNADSDVRLRVDIADGLEPITANTDQLERVIANVIQNAYEALDGKGTIRVHALPATPGDDDAAAIEIRVEDDGPGMDESTLDRVFVPFYTTKATGTGLGLALCERLVGELGGRIRMSSRPGHGATVSIRLPSGAAEGASEPDDAEGAAETQETPA